MRKAHSGILIGSLLVIALVAIVIIFKVLSEKRISDEIASYAGSESCRPCHENFYQLWSPSHHGTAMQPVTANFISDNIKTLCDGIEVNNAIFSVISKGDSLTFVQTKRSGEISNYNAVHAMGGKYIYYFLAEFGRGRLHVLPLAYDCKTNTWYNNPESGVRHFENSEDEALEWENHLYTFNTSCYSCHVSQLESNFNLNNLTYSTTWSEPGINCETCHGPSSEHVRVCVEAGEENIPDDLEIIITSTFTPEQHDASCGSCHSKTSIVAPNYPPGDEFYDYFNLITLESRDYYADARDLGENYTMTSWSMNSCRSSGEMHCVTCHTSSGRYRFGGENPNQACAPCHDSKVNNVENHTHHKKDGPGAECIACHMPKTTFARMDRSDHSFRPPMPLATIEFGSQNACNICHDDKSPQWANEQIAKTHKREYQEETLKLGRIITNLREDDWSDLDDIVDGLVNNRFDEIYTTSFIRLLENCSDHSKWDGIFASITHQSPLVRSAAAHALSSNGSPQAVEHLKELAEDEFRVVRMNAAFAISYYRLVDPSIMSDTSIINALNEYERALTSRPDDWASHYNLGNFYSNANDIQKALQSYENSYKVYPEAIMPMINAGYLYSLSGNVAASEKIFEKALSIQPDNEAAILNLALLYGESGKTEKAVSYFRQLFRISEKNAVAAFNLSILLSETDRNESLGFIKLAYEWDPNARYGYTYAYYLGENNRSKEAISILMDIIELNPEYLDSYYLITNLLVQDGRSGEARKILNDALIEDSFNAEQKRGLQEILKSIV